MGPLFVERGRRVGGGHVWRSGTGVEEEELEDDAEQEEDGELAEHEPLGEGGREGEKGAGHVRGDGALVAMWGT